jgi:hypothetical protein
VKYNDSNFIILDESFQGCQIVRDTMYQNGEKYQITTKLPNGCHAYILNGHEIYQHFPFQDPQKFTQIGIFGFKINHLATLFEI